ncbi:MAG TPA: hypothetical protein VFZ42_06620 [Chitinophagaceae bacterium]
MKIAALLYLLYFTACNNQVESEKTEVVVPYYSNYNYLKESLESIRIHFKQEYSPGSLSNSEMNLLANHWVNSISDSMYRYWSGTSWDFNGITNEPRNGQIACGYFVTAVLQHMGCRINRVKLSTCASMTMMKSLAPAQKIKNLSSLSYPAFNDRISEYGKGIYVIGLDFHTGFIINDGKENWFLHSNYINKKGVVKEKIWESAALKSSRTRFLVSLTGDRHFLENWLRY